MKRSLSFVLIILIAAISLSIFVQTSMAADILLDTQIKKMTIAADKNGNDYVRFIIEEQKSLNGIQYTPETVVMCFGGIVNAAKKYSEGGSLKAIVATNEYKGRVNYNVLAFIK